MEIILFNAALFFVIKVFDNLLSTGKTILVQKNKGIFAGLTVIASQIIFYKLISAVSTNGDYLIYVIAVASGVGTYLAVLLNDKFSKDKTYVNVILSDDREAMEKFRDFLMANKITSVATDAYTKSWGKTIAITAYAETKEESKKIDKYIEESETKFKRKITKGK